METTTELVKTNGAHLMAPKVETGNAAVAAQMEAQIRARYALAQLRPRHAGDVRTKLLKACERPRFAETAIYKVPRGGKDIEGPSIRFAEEAARCLGNVSVETSLVHDDAERRIVRVSVIDIEANLPYSQDVVVEKYVERRQLKQGVKALSTRTNSFGDVIYRVEATEDDLLFKQNALTSKAVRTLILRILPGDILDEAVTACKQLRASTDKTDPEATKKRIMDRFAEVGVMPSDVQAYLRHSLDHITADEFEDLRSLHTAITEGETTWAQVMAARAPDKKDEPKAAGAAPATAKELAEQRKAKKAAEAAAKAESKDEPKTAAPPAETGAMAPPAASSICAECGDRDGHYKGCPNGDSA